MDVSICGIFKAANNFGMKIVLVNLKRVQQADQKLKKIIADQLDGKVYKYTAIAHK